MTVIEADGQNTQPMIVDSIQIFAGTLSPHYSFFQVADKYQLTITRPALLLRRESISYLQHEGGFTFFGIASCQSGRRQLL